MIDSLSFVNNHWFWYVVIVAILLWLVFAWKEWKQDNKSKLYLKLILAFVALTSLTLIVLKPLVVSNLDNYNLVLLTKGYNQERLDSLKKAKKKIQVLDYKANKPFINTNKKPSSIYILGEGIAPYDFYQMDSLNVNYLGDQTPSGIVKLNYTEEQVVGNSVTVEGLYAKPEKGKKLVLESPSKISMDSVVFANDSTSNFKLSTQLNIIGNYEFHIVEKDSTNNTITSNPIGISVIPESTLSILIINGFPTFETKYLKNYLAEKGHQTVVRSQVTRGKFKYEYFNLNNKPTVDFSEKSLQNFDLVIIDAQSFANLGRNQKSVLETVIRNDGLGLYIQPNSVLNSIQNYLTDFSFQSDNITTSYLENSPKTNISKLPFNFQPLFSLHAIHQTNGYILSAYKPLSNGRIGTSVFNNTFQLILNGNNNIYQTLWSEIINALSKKQIPSSHWESKNMLSFKDEPFHFSIRTYINNPRVVDSNNELIPLMNDIDNNSLWKGKTYPKKIGWQSLSLEQDTTQVFHYYVTDTSKWKSLQSHKTIEANTRQFVSKTTTDNPYKTRQPIPLIWLYILFLLSISYLWLEPKL